MGCCASSPHTRRRYADPADLDECIIPEDQLPLHQGHRGRIGPLRTFGKYRPNSVWVPDDIDGLPSTHMDNGQNLATDPNTLLYSAEIDNGRACRCCRPVHSLWCCPPLWPFLVAQGLTVVMEACTCDEYCCWVRKEYMNRNYYRVYPNRVEINDVQCRFFGMCGCGSWNADNVVAHPFDRGAFGFRPVRCGSLGAMCCIWPIYGGIVARQRCQCNGPLWYGCNGWWCDEWLCDMFFCSYRYVHLADAEETAVASSLALQAYFEGRSITKDDIDKCLDYWRENISERHDPIERKRDICCESCLRIPLFCTGVHCYRYLCQCKRLSPYAHESNKTDELKNVYEKYEESRQRQIERYESFVGPVQKSTCCRAFGCRRVFGRRGVIFCTEGCFHCCFSDIMRRQGDLFPPYLDRDLDDDNDAATILAKVLGEPPSNVVYKKWEIDGAESGFKVVTYPKREPVLATNGKRKEKDECNHYAEQVDIEAGFSLATGTFGME